MPSTQQQQGSKVWGKNSNSETFFTPALLTYAHHHGGTLQRRPRDVQFSNYLSRWSSWGSILHVTVEPGLQQWRLHWCDPEALDLLCLPRRVWNGEFHSVANHLSQQRWDSQQRQDAYPVYSLPTVRCSASLAPSFLSSAWLRMSQKGDKHSSSVQDPLRGRCKAENCCWQSHVVGDRKPNIRDLPTVPEQVTAARKESWSQWRAGEISALALTHLHACGEAPNLMPGAAHASQHHSFLLGRRKSNLHETEKHVWGWCGSRIVPELHNPHHIQKQKRKESRRTASSVGRSPGEARDSWVPHDISVSLLLWQPYLPITDYSRISLYKLQSVCNKGFKTVSCNRYSFPCCSGL